MSRVVPVLARVIAAAIGTALLVVASPTPAQACTCASEPPRRVAAEAKVLFVGRLVATGAPETHGPHTDYMVATYRVKRVYRGRVTETVGVEFGMCLGPSGSGRRWLVGAAPSSTRGVVYSDGCSTWLAGTRWSKRVIATAEPGKAPLPGTGPPASWVEAHDGDLPLFTKGQVLWGAVVAAAGTVVVAGVLVLRRWRRRVNPRVCERASVARTG